MIPDKQRLPRKIVGMNNLNRTRITQSYSEEISINSNTATINMERLRVTNMMSNQADFWQYGQYIAPICGPPNMAVFQAPPAIQYPHIRMFHPPMPIQHIAIGSQLNRRPNPVDVNNVQNNGGFISNSDYNLMPPRPTVQTPYEGFNHQDDAFIRSRDTSPISYESFLKDAEKIAINSSDNLENSLYNEKVKALTLLGLRGSELAEKLAHSHRNRPCFKKIDSLCARMKQDLIRPDGVLPNINSQGTAWAVKDFIFVFTRVMNAWIIIKGYVYNTPEGLNKVKGATSPDFAEKFSAWQDATIEFIESLIKSFVSLDELVQSQKSAFQKPEAPIQKNNPTVTTRPVKTPEEMNNFFENSFELNDDNLIDNNYFKSKATVNPIDKMNKNYLYTLVEDSEETQRKATTYGTYFKTGTYNPIQKDYNSDSCDGNGTHSTTISTPPSSPPSTQSSTRPSTPPSVSSFSATPPFSPTSSTQSSTHSSPQPAPLLTPPIKILTRKPSKNMPEKPHSYHLPQSFDHPSLKSIWTYNENDVRNTGGGDSEPFFEINKSEPSIKEWISYDFPVIENKLTDLSSEYDPNVVKPLGNDVVELFKILINRLIKMKYGHYFLNSNFISIYFPQFIWTHRNIKELRVIIIKCQYGGYLNLYQVVHDLKTVCYEAKIFLKVSDYQKDPRLLFQEFNNDDCLKKAISAYENEIDEILKEPPFESFNFDHITGHPNEAVTLKLE